MRDASHYTEFSMNLDNEQRKGLEFLLQYYTPFTRPHAAVLHAMEAIGTDPKPIEIDGIKPNRGKQTPRQDRGLFFVCTEPGCNALCPAEMMKCSKHREPLEPLMKTDDPEEFYINPKFKKQ